MLVLEKKGTTYKRIGRTTIVQLPIRLEDHRSSGLPDIDVHVQGGGKTSGYDFRLVFNGKSYPSNPSVFPAQKLAEASKARVIIPITDVDRLLH